MALSSIYDRRFGTMLSLKKYSKINILAQINIVHTFSKKSSSRNNGFGNQNLKKNSGRRISTSIAYKYKYVSGSMIASGIVMVPTGGRGGGGAFHNGHLSNSLLAPGSVNSVFK